MLRARRSNRGQSLVEFALLLPLILLLFAGTTEMGFMLNERINQNRFTASAAKYGSTLQFVPDAEIFIATKALQDASSIDVSQLVFLSKTNVRYGPYKLSSAGTLQTIAGTPVTAFAENLFFRNDNNTVTDTSDDAPCEPTNWRAAYVEVKSIYPHQNVIPMASTMGMGTVDMMSTSVFPVVPGTLSDNPNKRLSGAAPVTVFKESWQVGQAVVLKGDITGPGSFGWLDLDENNTLGINKTDALAGWLTGTVDTPDTIVPPCYTNCFTGQVNAANVQAAATSIIGTQIVIPLHDGTQGSGLTLEYHMVSFAVFTVTSFDVNTQTIGGSFVRYI